MDSALARTAQGREGSLWSGEVGLPQVAMAACQRMLHLYTADGAAVWLHSDRGLRCVAQAGTISMDDLPQAPVSRLMHRALRLGRAGRTDAERAGTTGHPHVAVSPLRREGEVIGVLVLLRPAVRPFSAQELAQVGLASEGLGMALHLQHIGEQLRASEAQYRHLFQRNPLPMYVSTFEDRRIIAANPAVLKLYGYSETEFLELTSGDLLWEQTPMSRAVLLAQTAGRHHIQGLQRRHRTSDGRPLDVEIWTDEMEFDGRIARLVLVYDVTARVQAQRELARVSRAQQMLSACNDALIRSRDEADLLGRICRIAQERGGYRRAQVAMASHDATRSIRLLDGALPGGDTAPQPRLSWDPERPGGQSPIARVIRSGLPCVIDDIDQHLHELPNADECLALGLRHLVYLPLRDADQTLGVLSLMADAEHGSVGSSELALLMELANNLAHGIGHQRVRLQRRADAARIATLAYSDGLTGLPNRARLQEQLLDRIKATREQGMWSSLMLLDIHNLKALNEVWGHDEGDRLLKAFAQRLSRLTDGACARMGADEFVVLLGPHGGDETQAAREAEDSARRLLQGLAHAHHSEAWVFECQSSMGLVMFNGRDGGTRELLQRAEIALYAAKAEGPQTVRRYDRELHATVVARAQLDQDLREAIHQRQFELYYQPQCDASGEWLGAEALVRWRHPQAGWVSPGSFIPACEDNGLILPLGQQVLEMACATLAQWQREPRLAAMCLSVNVSARQFRQPDFVRQVTRILAQSGAPAQALKLELTESVMVDDVDRLIEKMKALRDLGVRFSLDDFGTGYSSLGQLKRLPLDQIKIDQSFVRDVLTDPNDASIVQAVIQLGASLGLHVIAEGVETADQRAALAAYGCPAYQGYLLGKPMPRPAVEQMLSASLQAA